MKPVPSNSPYLWLVITVVACSLLSLTLLDERGNDGAPWINIMDAWHPSQSSESAYQFDLPAPNPVRVTAIKHAGGMHNRFWDLLVDENLGPAQPVARRWRHFGDKQPWQGAGRRLTERTFAGSNDRVFDEAAPRLYYRRHGELWQFLTYQRLDAPDDGPCEVVPRGNIPAGKDVYLGEGYFTWEFGQGWHACDSQGRATGTK